MDQIETICPWISAQPIEYDPRHAQKAHIIYKSSIIARHLSESKRYTAGTDHNSEKVRCPWNISSAAYRTFA